MTNPETFFQNLGQQIEDRVLDRGEELEQQVPTDLPFEQRLNRMLAARLDAQSTVLAEMLPRAQDDETGQ
jgi:hypothetical protein